MKHTKKITILHSNDLHGDFLAEQVDEKLVGGVSMLSGYIEKVRAEQPNTIYAIAGDMFRGSVIDSEYKGLSTIEIMNALAPDVVTIGNHEVDYGIAHLLFIEKCARFPIINANLYIKNTPTRLFTPYKILRMDGMNILFIGIITQDVINQTKSESLVGSFVDTAAAAAEVGKICNAHNSIDIDFTVLLTHIGFEEDKHLARQLDPAWGVDLIIGGHSHTLPEHAVEENGVVIAQAGTGTDQIGRFDIIVDTDNNCIDSYTWRTVPICAETCPRNPAMEQVLHRFTSQVDEKYSHIVGRFRRELTHPERTQETELGNLFADIFTRSLGIDIMLIGSGSIRAEKLGPIVTYGDLIEGFPYDDGVFMFKVTGRQLRQMLHYMLREEAYTGHTEFYQLPSTLRLRYDRAKGDFDYFTYCGKEVGKEISDDALFTVGLQNYHFKNIESFFNISYETICKLQKPRSVATSCQDVLMLTFCKITGGLLIMKSTYLLPWFKMTTWYFRLSRLLKVSNIKRRTKNHGAVADRIFMLVKNHVLAVSGMGEVRPRYSCFYKIRHPGDCDGQSGYGVSKLDSIVEEVVRQIFAQFREVSRKKLLESVKTNDAARIQKKVKKIQKDLESKQKELDDLKAETILVIRGVSALDKELLGTLVAEAREALETLEKQLVQAQEEYEEATKTAKRSNYICNELFTWADVYDTANHDERRAILQQFIKEIRVRKDYEISITLNASFNQVEQLKAVSTYDGAEIFEGISEKGA
ncbi:MAG: 5'-nucleotidase C-terminal domain-containing protein [Faecalibacterium prausnitzii]